MAMSRRKDRARARTPGLWIATNALPVTGGHPFYQRLNQVLDTHAFDACVEAQCAPFYAATVGRPSLLPGTYYRLLLIGDVEGIDSERGIAWRPADSLALRGVLGLDLDEAPPEHSTISRTRRLIDLETHRAVFTWILQVLATTDLVTGQTIGIDATTLEANAALRSSVRRDSGETYQEFLTRLAQASGIETPTRADLARVDRKRPKKGRNTDWRHLHDPDARITKMKDGRTHLAHKAEHAVDLETGAIVGVTVQGADQGDTTTIAETVTAAGGGGTRGGGGRDGRTDGGDRRGGGRQGVSQQSGAGGSGGARSADVHRRAESRAAQLEEEDGGPGCGVCPSPAHPRRAWAGLAAAAERTSRTAERTSLRNRRPAAAACARACEHPQTPPHPNKRLQRGPPHADTDRRRHAARPPGAPGGGSGHSSSPCGHALSTSGVTITHHPAITRPQAHRIIVSNYFQSARQNGPFHHGLLGVSRRSSTVSACWATSAAAPALSGASRATPRGQISCLTLLGASMKS